jgi:biotin operon repressor
MHFIDQAGANPSEPAQPGADRFAPAPWLTVTEAVLYYAGKGLPRTPKTLRKWARRSSLFPDDAELDVRREDVENGDRWVIERGSLDRKIAQERELMARRADEPVHTGADPVEPVRTGSDVQTLAMPDATAPEPAQTGANQSEIIEALHDRITNLKAEVAFYREELTDRRNATAAITGVIEAFRLSAGANAAARSERQHRAQWEGDRTRHGIETDMILDMNDKRSGGMRSLADLLAEKNIILTGADAFTEKGFTQVPNAILRTSKLSMGAKMTYAALLSYAWHDNFCFPGQQRLADDIGVSRQTANEYVQEIKRKGYVAITRKGQGRPNVYELKVRKG